MFGVAVAACAVMLYAAETTLLAVKPEAVAIALIVRLDPTLSVLVYCLVVPVALVAGFVIRAYGSGPVRGFATTLIIGLLASMFTSIVVTRAIVEWFVGHGRLHKAVSF